MSVAQLEEVPASISRGRDIPNALKLPTNVLTGENEEGSAVHDGFL